MLCVTRRPLPVKMLVAAVSNQRLEAHTGEQSAKVDVMVEEKEGKKMFSGAMKMKTINSIPCIF